MERLSIPRVILAIVYLAFAAMGAFSVFSGDLSIARLGMLAAVVITLLALVRKLGRWAQIVGLIVGSLYTVIGVAMLGLGVWAMADGNEDAAAMLIVAPLLLGLGVPTILSLRADMRSRSAEA